MLEDINLEAFGIDAKKSHSLVNTLKITTPWKPEPLLKYEGDVYRLKNSSYYKIIVFSMYNGTRSPHNIFMIEVTDDLLPSTDNELKLLVHGYFKGCQSKGLSDFITPDESIILNKIRTMMYDHGEEKHQEGKELAEDLQRERDEDV